MEIKQSAMALRTINDRLRNSLTGILGNAQFLSEEYLTPEQQAMVSAILTCANELKKLADDMLEKKTMNTVNSTLSFRLSVNQ